MRQSRPLAGIRVVEVAAWVATPSAALTLANWGADVVKVEPLPFGDPIRGGRPDADHGTRGVIDAAATHLMRGKRSLGLDLRRPEGRGVMRRLLSAADVFVTSLRQPARARYGIDVPDVHAINERIVYGRGTALGPRGPERDRGGFDFASFWSRGGLADAYDRSGGDPPPQNAGFGDLLLGAVLAGGIAAALVGRSAGAGAVVDSSLLALGAWSLAFDITAAGAGQGDTYPRMARQDRADPLNPLLNMFKTKDGRDVAIVIVDSAEASWKELCDDIGRPDLASRAQYADAVARQQNKRELTAALQEVFAGRTLAEWRAALRSSSVVWEPVQTPAEVARDPQATANGYVTSIGRADGSRDVVVAPPVQFDELGGEPGSVAAFGEHTVEILLELGYSSQEVAALQEQGIVGCSPTGREVRR